MPCNVSVRGAFQLTPSARRATRSRPFGPAMPENFNPRPPRGGRPGGGLKNAFTVFISIHALREEGDAALTIFFSLWAISIHALREESDNPAGCSQQPARYFNPRPPRGERQCDDHAPEAPETISIHALRGESDLLPACTAVCSLLISIHALRGESDYIRPLRPVSHGNFNPRPPRGGRHAEQNRQLWTKEFQSTPSARRATSCTTLSALSSARFQSTPSARRATGKPPLRMWLLAFQSTPSARRATGQTISQCATSLISIHALREEGDAPRVLNYRPKANFNPRPPRGGRRLNGGYWDNEEVFQSTPSARRATAALRRTGPRRGISIHALREEGDYFRYNQ